MSRSSRVAVVTIENGERGEGVAVEARAAAGTRCAGPEQRVPAASMVFLPVHSPALTWLACVQVLVLASSFCVLSATPLVPRSGWSVTRPSSQVTSRSSRCWLAE
ncbi:hypothetical protein ADK74_07875 [Streptomyces decoyicus]|nr:hypothetical protein ADK74_07875 [Streptomyces decoyicus]